MKPYRRILLASAVLLAALPLSSCGEAGDWKKTTEIKLTSNKTSVEVKEEVIFTVQSPPPAPVDGYQCETDLEYRAEGAGLDAFWYPVPGDGPTRVFVLEPRTLEPFAVVARGKCVDAREDWKYSNQLNIEVTDPSLPTITLTANPASVARNNPVTFTLGATTPSEGMCNLGLSYEYSGAGFAGVTVVNPAHVGQFILTPSAVGNLTVTAKGWCTQNSSKVVFTTVNVAVTAVTLPKVTSIILTAVPNPYVTPGINVIFTVSATKDAVCTASFEYTRTGGGISAGTFDVPASMTFILNPVSGPLTVFVTGKCSQNPTDITQSNTVIVAQ